MGFIRKHGRLWCVHNEATGKVIVAKGRRRCHRSKKKARDVWHELDCKYTGRHCRGLAGLEELGAAQFCVRLPASPAKTTSGYAVYRLSKSELGRMLKKKGPMRWTRAARGLGATYHPTAIARPRLPAPLRVLMPPRGCGRALYHGVGRDRAGMRALRKRCRSVVPYDPHHPDPQVRRKPKGRFSEILSIYVLNVIPKAQGRRVLREIHRLLTPGGHATIAVRRDTC